jgi:alpha-tubulin suppressor-like RCC1 family protein
MFGVAGEDWKCLYRLSGSAGFASQDNMITWAWGRNNSGQLGDNTTTNRASPISVSSADSFAAITSGTYFCLAIRGSDGRLFSWGNNSFGQLGDNTRTSRSVPGSVSSADSFAKVVGTPEFSLAIRGSDGRLFAWGRNLYGQLGDNTRTSRSVPVSVSSADSFVAIAGGYGFTLAIRGSDGRLFSWGDNTSGQLGDNTRTSRSVPGSVSSADSFVAIACGSSFCLAIKGSDGRLFSWGNNQYGQLGDNTTTSRSVPGSVSSADSFIKIASCVNHSLAIKASDRQVYSWGRNEYGQLGDGTLASRSVPGSIYSSDSWREIVCGQNISFCINYGGAIFSWGDNLYGQLGVNSFGGPRSVPSSVSSANSFVKVAITNFTLAIRGSDGRLFAWGLNGSGQLGNNSRTNEDFPVSVSSADSFVAMAVGVNFCLAIKGSDGRLFAWGDNSSGQLGDNTRTSRSVPGSVSSADSFVMVALSSHSLAIRGSDGRLFSWGNNSFGQLGDNTTTSRSVPGSVSSADSFVMVAANSHSLAIRGDGRLFAWGLNGSGQLGNNSITGRSVPVSVSSADSFVMVAVGDAFSLAIRGSDGRLFAWGYNTYGQLGDNTLINKSVPISVSSADSFVAIAGGYSHTSAIRGDGRLFSWGNNSFGQLGDNTTTSRSVPGSVSSADSFIKIGVGFSTSLAIRGSEGRLFAWGSNQYGELGTGANLLKTPNIVCKLPG